MRSVLPAVVVALAACAGPRGDGPAAPDDTGGDPSGPDTCMTGQEWDGATCVPEGCGAAPWGTADPADAYVDAAAAEGGDGSSSAPFRTLADGVAHGGVVAVAAGTYTEALDLGDDHDGLVLRGRCAALVTLDGSPAGADRAAVMIEGSRRTTVTVEGVTVTGGPVGAFQVLGGALAGRGLVVAGDETVGFIVFGPTAAAELEDLVVTDVVAPRGNSSDAFEIGDGAEVTVRRATIDGAERLLVLAANAGTALHFEDVAFGARTGKRGVAGVELDAGVSATFLRTTFVDQRNAAVVAIGEGTDATFEDLVVTDTRAGGVDVGIGIKVQDEAAVSVEGATFSGSDGFDVVALDGGSVTLTATVHAGPGVALQAQTGGVLSATDVTAADSDGSTVSAAGGTVHLGGARITGAHDAGEGDGVALLAGDGGLLVAEDTTIEGARGMGIGAGTGGTVVATGVTVTDTVPDDDSGGGGFGLHAWDGGTVRFAAGSVADATRIAAVSFGGGSVLELDDVDLLDTAFDPDGALAAGVVTMEGATSTATGLRVEGAGAHGIYVDGAATTVQLDDVDVHAVDPDRAGAYGRGIDLYGGARGTFARVTVAEVHEVGVLVSGSGTTLDGEDLVVDGVAAGTANTTGMGIVVEDGATWSGTGVSVSHVAGPGLLVTRAAATCTTCTFTDDAFAGVVLKSASVTLLGGTIAGIGEDASAGGGAGVWAGSSGDTPNTLLLQGVTVGDHAYAAVWLAAPGAYTVDGCDLAGSGGVDGVGVLHGNALFATGGIGPWDGTSGLRVTGSTLHDATGVAMLLDGASATVEDDTWRDNGVDLVRQGCGALPAVVGAEEVPDAEECPDTERVVAALDYAIVLEDAGVAVE